MLTACCITSCHMSKASRCASGSIANSSLPIEEAVHHGRAIASALDYAHRQNIVHRDIKPENVMMYEGEAMVMDFGIAKAVSAAGSETLTQTGMMVGTPAYVSPEQAAGETNLDGRSDQYSLACVVYEMLCGERPFSGTYSAVNHGKAILRNRGAAAHDSGVRFPRTSRRQ